MTIDDYLTPLEKRILEMNALGMSQKDITKQIGYVSERPLRRILRDLAARGHKVSFSNIRRSYSHNKVAELVLAGKRSKEIAAELGLRVSTIKGLMTKARKDGLLPRLEPRDFPRDSVLQKQAKSLRELGSVKLDYGGRRYDDPSARKCGE